MAKPGIDVIEIATWYDSVVIGSYDFNTYTACSSLYAVS